MSTAESVHASRTAPKCRDCEHHLYVDFMCKGFCNHPSAPVSPVNGWPLWSADDARHDERVCGAAGRLFVRSARLPHIPQPTRASDVPLGPWWRFWR